MSTYDLLSNPFQSFGIGGSAPTYMERARLTFADDIGRILYGHDIPLLIHHPTADAMRVPSLLGRDIIDRWRVTYDKSVSELVAEVVSADTEFPV